MSVADADIRVSDQDKTKDEEVAMFRATSYVDTLPLSLIKKSDVALRDVQRQSEGYMTLLQSVKRIGVMNSITVREQVDPITKTKCYGLIDGLQRFTAAGDAGMETIPCNVVKMDDAEVLEAQLIGNLQRIATKNAEVAKQLVRILNRNPLMTMQQLSERVCQSKTWVEQRLSLLNLDDKIKELVNSNEICLANAYALSQLDKEEQLKFVDSAISEPSKTFVPTVKQRVKELKEARKTGADATKVGFTPIKFLQKNTDVQAEYEQGCPIGQTLLTRKGLTTPEAVSAWNLAIAWMLHFDELSIEEQKRKYDLKEAEKKEAAERNKIEKEAQKARDAASKASSLETGF